MTPLMREALTDLCEHNGIAFDDISADEWEAALDATTVVHRNSPRELESPATLYMWNFVAQRAASIKAARHAD